MKRVVALFSSALVALAIVMSGCNGSGGKDSNHNGANGGISFDMKLSSLYEGSVANDGKTTSFTSDDVMVGELAATNVETGVSETYVWSVFLDETTLEMQSNKTIVLEPGSYRFELTLTKDNYKYFGEAVSAIVDYDQKVIPLTVRPVIGDTVVNADIVSVLAGFKLHYDPSELQNIIEPKIGVIIDNGDEDIYRVNKTTGR